MLRVFFFLTLILSGCNQTDKKKPINLIKEDRITRKSNEYRHVCALPKQASFPVYGWEKGGPPKITKEYFRCRGNCFHPSVPIEENGEVRMATDCNGFKSHSLPTRGGEEFIYPILIDLLNWVQEATKKAVVITSGHRCPKHNTYADPSNIYSKHMIGAEVSFYVEGEEPERLVQIIQDFYKNSEFEVFRRYEGKTNVSTLPWMNKEIFIKLYKSDEGRSFDNQHGHPYLSIQVRHDRDLDEVVAYTWAKANKGYYQK